MSEKPVNPEILLIKQAIAFADWAAGEGICPCGYNDPDAETKNPDEFLLAYSTATGDEDWSGLADKISAAITAKDAEIARLRALNEDAHAIVSRIWAIFGNPSYEDLAGRTIYDLVGSAVHDAAQLKDALGTEFCVLFLDGRNEHGSHVLASYPRSFDVVDDDISEQAEAILVAAESEGFEIGQHVWAEFDWVAPQYGDEGRVELSGYWEFKRVNAKMTRDALKENANAL